jgi:ParB family transcriptional regulator, chromosome partitioning protein
MHIILIDVSKVIVPDGRRIADPDWVVALGEDMRDHGQDTPIDVVEVEGGYRLIAGLHRLSGMKHVGSPTILARVMAASEFANEAAIKLREISENFKRRPLSVLDRAFDVAQWREIYEDAVGAVKRGRKGNSLRPETIADDALLTISSKFAESFGAASQKAFHLSRAEVYRALKIASIGQPNRERISLHAIADNQSELLALAAEPAARQIMIINLMISEPPSASSVATAIAIIDRVPPVAPAEAWAKVSDKFAKLPELAKRRFLQEHWDLIEIMISESRKVA